MSLEEINEQKNVEFYAASVNAWYNTSLEYDKSIFALSAGGVGLLTTLLTAVGVHSVLLLFLYGAAIFSFLISLVALLFIFQRNKQHVEDVLAKGQVESDPRLKMLDSVALLAFGAGAAFAACVGVVSAFHSYESEQAKMTTKKPNCTASPELINKSFTGVSRLQSSFNGIGKVQPQSVGTPVASPAAAPTPTPTPAPTKGTDGATGK